MDCYRDKIIYITGGSSGIGYAAAQIAISFGARVVIFARDSIRLNTARNSLIAQSNLHSNSEPSVSAFSLDVCNLTEVETVMQQALQKIGAPDLLINSAGVAYPGYFSEVDHQVFQETIHINLLGPWFVTKVLVPHLKTGSHVVNVSSVAGLVGIFGYTAYCASKFGLIGFSEALRSELKPQGINVSVLCPPDTDTPQYHQENKIKPPETRAITRKANLMRADAVALYLFRNLEKHKFLIVPGFESKFIILVNRFFPSLVRWIMDRDVRLSKKVG